MANMQTTTGGISYEEMPGSPSLSGSRDSHKGVRKFLVPWSKIDDFLVEFWPSIENRGWGWEFPEPLGFPGLSWLKALTYSVEPYDPDAIDTTASQQHETGLDTYGVRAYKEDLGAIVTIEYGVPPYDVYQLNWLEDGTNILVNTDRAYSAEVLKLGKSGWKWGADNLDIKAEDAQLGKIIPQVEYNCTWLYVPQPPFWTIQASVGCVNSTQYPFYAPINTLLLIGAEVKRSYARADQYAFTIHYKFLQKWVKTAEVDLDARNPDGTLKGIPAKGQIGWNHIFRTDCKPPKWDYPYYEEANPGSGTGATTPRYLYPEMDFKKLFMRDFSWNTMPGA